MNYSLNTPFPPSTRIQPELNHFQATAHQDGIPEKDVMSVATARKLDTWQKVFLADETAEIDGGEEEEANGSVVREKATYGSRESQQLSPTSEAKKPTRPFIRACTEIDEWLRTKSPICEATKEAIMLVMNTALETLFLTTSHPCNPPTPRRRLEEVLALGQTLAELQHAYDQLTRCEIGEEARREAMRDQAAMNGNGHFNGNGNVKDEKKDAAALKLEVQLKQRSFLRQYYFLMILWNYRLLRFWTISPSYLTSPPLPYILTLSHRLPRSAFYRSIQPPPNAAPFPGISMVQRQVLVRELKKDPRTGSKEDGVFGHDLAVIWGYTEGMCKEEEGLWGEMVEYEKERKEKDLAAREREKLSKGKDKIKEKEKDKDVQAVTRKSFQAAADLAAREKANGRQSKSAEVSPVKENIKEKTKSVRVKPDPDASPVAGGASLPVDGYRDAVLLKEEPLDYPTSNSRQKKRSTRESDEEGQRPAKKSKSPPKDEDEGPDELQFFCDACESEDRVHAFEAGEYRYRCEHPDCQNTDLRQFIDLCGKCKKAKKRAGTTHLPSHNTAEFMRRVLVEAEAPPENIASTSAAGSRESGRAATPPAVAHHSLDADVEMNGRGGSDSDHQQSPVAGDAKHEDVELDDIWHLMGEDDEEEAKSEEQDEEMPLVARADSNAADLAVTNGTSAAIPPEADHPKPPVNAPTTIPAIAPVKSEAPPPVEEYHSSTGSACAVAQKQGIETDGKFAVHLFINFDVSEKDLTSGPAQWVLRCIGARDPSRPLLEAQTAWPDAGLSITGKVNDKKPMMKLSPPSVTAPLMLNDPPTGQPVDITPLLITAHLGEDDTGTHVRRRALES